MKFVLVSDEKIIFEGEASEINCMSQYGPFTIMDEHIPYISKIKEAISFREKNNNELKFNLSEGFIYTNGTTCFAVIETH